MKYLKYIAVSSAVLAAPAWAAEDEADAPRNPAIVVVATGSAVPIAQAGQSISVIGAEEIASVQGADLTRVLERAPGVTFTRNGGMGGFTGLRVRGAEGEQLLVMVDGVRVADVASPGGGFDFGTLLAGNVGRIELLRGSNSVIWGSRAIGGVLAVTTREVEGLRASAEAGAHDTVYATAGAGLGGERLSAGIDAGWHRSDGISAAAVGRERDAFREWDVSARARYALGDGLALLANLRHANSRLEIDGFPPPTYFTFDDTREFQKQREWSGRLGADYTSEALELYAGYTLQDTRRELVDPDTSADPYFTSKGRDQRAELRGRYRLAAALSLDFGAEHEWSRFVTGPFFGAGGKARQTSAHALLGWRGGPVSLAGGLRYDDHSGFGSAWTLGANGSVGIARDWRIRASYGEGFKAPTLYQLLSDFGNATLRPERSRSYDLGVERGDRNAGLHLAATVFRRDTRQQIDFVSCGGRITGICANRPFGVYDNVARARATGLELELGAQVSPRLRAQAAYTWVKAQNRLAGSPNRGNDLSRRPRHAVTVWADWRTPWHDVSLGADLRMVGDSFDDAGNLVRLDGYALVTLRASVPLGERLELFGRVENVADVAYQTVAGYATAGRSGYMGVRAKF